MQMYLEPPIFSYGTLHEKYQLSWNTQVKYHFATNEVHLFRIIAFIVFVQTMFPTLNHVYLFPLFDSAF